MSAPGPDGLNCEILKKCVLTISEPIALLFTKSLEEGSVPELCKRAAVVPIYKGGERSDPSNYRPISLTPILMKVMEKIVREQIVNFMTDNNLFNQTQHGFMRGRSCLSALLSVYDQLMQNLSECPSSCIDMIYLDFSKAFDKVDHGILMHKLRNMGITGSLGKWLLDFLSDRKHFVRIPGGTSTDGKVLSGVPQGTVLGPLLFLVLLSDISEDINQSNLVSFADDTRIFKQIDDVDNCSVLQRDLGTIYTWASINNMTFNDSKFEHISFHHQIKHRSDHNVYISACQSIIKSKEHIRDLGITMSADCSFEVHISEKIKQCRQLTGWILRTFSVRDKHTMLTLFKSLVLPRLEYGCQLWSPIAHKYINAIESIQRHFTKRIIDMKHLTYQNRLKSLHMYSLQRRRDRYSAIYTWKLLENIVPNLSPPIEQTFSERRGRLSVLQTVETGRIGTLSHNSFRWRGSRLFNSLPPAIRNITKICGVEFFKRELDYFLCTLLDTCVFRMCTMI